MWCGCFCTKIGEFTIEDVWEMIAHTAPLPEPELACRLGQDTWYLICIPSDWDLPEWAGVFVICLEVVRYALVRAHKHMFPLHMKTWCDLISSKISTPPRFTLITVLHTPMALPLHVHVPMTRQVREV